MKNRYLLPSMIACVLVPCLIAPAWADECAHIPSYTEHRRASSQSASTGGGQLDASGVPDRAEARKLLQRGIQKIAAGEHAQALDVLMQSLAASPDAEVLFQIGIAHHHLGNNEEAMEFYRRYLSTSPSRKRRAEVEVYLDNIRKNQESAQAIMDYYDDHIRGLRAACKAAASRAESGVEYAAKLQEQADQVKPLRAERDRWKARAGRAEATARSWKSKLGLGMVVVGGAALGGAGLSAWQARSMDRELSAMAPEGWNPDHHGWLLRDGERLDRAALTLSIAGGLALASGAALYWLDGGSSTESASVAVTPTIVPGGGGVQVTWSRP